MMRRILYTALGAILLLSSCAKENIGPAPATQTAETQQPGAKVKLSFSIALPGGAATRATIDSSPDIDNIYVAVFNNSGFFNEWVPATIESVTEANYDGTAATKYNLTVRLTTSESRLRLHFIANCPEKFRNAPPITGESSNDLEEIFMSKIRSQIGDTHNDGYWQKVLLPNGIKAKVTLDEDGVTEIFDTDPLTGDFLPTDETLAQVPDPIVLVRNFARIYLANLATNDQGVKDVTISKFALAYAPAEGLFAPILSNPYISDDAGNWIQDPDNHAGRTYFESFFINYQNYPLVAPDDNTPTLSDEPYFYTGYTPANLIFGTYPDENDTSKDANIPTLAEMIDWSEDTPLYMYERELPRRGQNPTRIIIYANKAGEIDGGGQPLYKYYALDIVNESGDYIPILRNNTYTIKLLRIEMGSGETSIGSAAGASSATVYGDINKQHVTEISNGISSIGTSYTEMMYVRPGTYELMFRYIATNQGQDANKERLDLVTLQIGSKDESNGAFTPVEASAATDNAFLISGGDYQVAVEKNGNTPISYIRSGNAWVAATQAQIEDSNIEKWGKIIYTTVGTDSDGLKDANGYFTQARTQTIRVSGTYEGKAIFRDVIIKLSPRRRMLVTCQQKYVKAAALEEEDLRVRIPTDLSRSIFPLQFKIEPAAHSLTPNGDVLPVTSGTSIVPNVNGPAYYFIKEITWEAYQGLPTLSESSSGQARTWKYFDCRFKTTTPVSECTVYVANDYFEPNADANDDFFNYYQRQFYNPTFTQDGTTIKFNCELDHDHTGNTVWWNPANDPNSYSDNYRVLPYAFTINIDGIDPKLDETTSRPVDSELSPVAGQDNTYLVILGNSSTQIDPDLRFVDLNFTLAEENTSGNYSIALSTANLSDNPSLYANASASGRFKIKRTGTYTVNVNTNATTYNGTGDATGAGISVAFTNTASSNGNNGYKQMGSRTLGLGYTYNNGIITITATNGRTITGITQVYRSGYNSQNVTYSPTATGSSNTSWTGSAQTVTITHSCTSSTQYNNRNRVYQLVISYEYYE